LKKVALKTIAKELGVSIATVSRALSGKPGVSDRLREQIVNTAKRLGYQPNIAATALRIGKSTTIGVLIPELSGSFFAEIVSSMEKVLSDAGYRVILCSTEDNPSKEAEHLQTLINLNVEGILSAPVGMKSNKQLYRRIIEDLKLPVVFFDRIVEGIEADNVVTDSKEGMRLLMDYLISKGHHKIGIIHPLKETSTGAERLKTFLEYKDKIKIRREWIKDGGSFEVGGYESFIEIMKLKEKPTALIIGNNLMTLGALKAIKRLKIKIPDDISIVSFDDASWNEIFDPPITCVSQDPYQIGLISASILLDKLKAKRKTTREKMRVVLKVKFIERRSVKKI